MRTRIWGCPKVAVRSVRELKWEHGVEGAQKLLWRACVNWNENTELRVPKSCCAERAWTEMRTRIWGCPKVAVRSERELKWEHGFEGVQKLLRTLCILNRILKITLSCSSACGFQHKFFLPKFIIIMYYNSVCLKKITSSKVIVSLIFIPNEIIASLIFILNGIIVLITFILNEIITVIIFTPNEAIITLICIQNEVIA